MAELGAGGISTFPGATPGAPYPQYFGIYFGVVNNTADPLNKHRCLLQVPQLFGTAVTTWATCLTPLTNAPAVGTVVTAMFIGGDVDYPVYLVTDPAMLALESNSANIQSVGTANAAGNSANAAAANHVHKLPLSAVAPLLDTNSSDIQSLGSQFAGNTGIPCDAGHVHSNIVNDLEITGNIFLSGAPGATFGWATSAYYPAGTGSSTFGGGAGAGSTAFNATAITDLENLQAIANGAVNLANYLYGVLVNAGIIA